MFHSLDQLQLHFILFSIFSLHNHDNDKLQQPIYGILSLLTSICIILCNKKVVSMRAPIRIFLFLFYYNNIELILKLCQYMHA